MKGLRAAIAAFFICAALSFAQSFTPISDTSLADSTGSSFTGQITIWWPNHDTVLGTFVPTGNMQVFVGNGVISLSLPPSFKFQYQAFGVNTNGKLYSASWLVPVSASPVNLAQITVGQGSSSLSVGSTAVAGGVSGNCLTDNSGTLGNQACGSIPFNTAANITASNCSAGQIAFASDATVGQNLFFCPSTNTWVQMWTIVGGVGVGCLPNPTTGVVTCSTDLTVMRNVALSALLDGTTVTFTSGVSICNAWAPITFGTHGGTRTLNVSGLTAGCYYTISATPDGSGIESFVGGTGCSWLGNGTSTGIPPFTSGTLPSLLSWWYDGASCWALVGGGFH